MAQFGAKYPCFAPFAGVEPAAALPTYEGGAAIGRLVTANLTVNLATGELYADDVLAEQVSEFASGTIAMETDDILDSVAEKIYGCTVAEKAATYKAGDTAPYGGLAYYKVLMRNGVKVFKGYFYPKVRAALGNDNAQTKGSSITFGASSTTFTVFAANEGTWRKTSEFATEAEARTWVETQVGMTQGSNPSA